MQNSSEERPLFPSYTLSVMVLGVFGFIFGLVLIAEGQPRSQAVPVGIVLLVAGLAVIIGFVPFITYLDKRAERKAKSTDPS